MKNKTQVLFVLCVVPCVHGCKQVPNQAASLSCSENGILLTEGCLCGVHVRNDINYSVQSRFKTTSGGKSVFVGWKVSTVSSPHTLLCLVYEHIDACLIAQNTWVNVAFRIPVLYSADCTLLVSLSATTSPLAHYLHFRYPQHLYLYNMPSLPIQQIFD
jgi:hypothetical protein